MRRIIQNYYTLALGLVAMSFFLSCKDDEIRSDIAKMEAKPAFTMDLDLGGVIDTKLPVEMINPAVLDASESELRAASISLEGQTREEDAKLKTDFKLVIDGLVPETDEASAKKNSIPAVIVYKYETAPYTQSSIFIGETTMKLSGPKTVGNTKYAGEYYIKTKSVNFYRLNEDGTTVDGENAIANAPYDNPTLDAYVKVFAGAKIVEHEGKKLITYGYASKTNESKMFMMDYAKGQTIKITDLVEHMPLISENWVKVLPGKGKDGSYGISNNSAESITKLGNSLTRGPLKAQGSILMLDLENKMSESNLKIEKLTVYSEALTSNIVYKYHHNRYDDKTDYDSKTEKDFHAEPVFLHKNRIADKERYFLAKIKSTDQTPINLGNSGGRKVFVFWAHKVYQELLRDEKWVQTSVVAQIEETQGQKGKYRHYWYNLPLMKTYRPLRQLRQGKVARLKINIEDGTPVHPMNFFAHRYVLRSNSIYDWDTNSTDVRWRDQYYDKSNIYNTQDHDEPKTMLYGWRVTGIWRQYPLTTLPFYKINYTRPMHFLNDNGVMQYYDWKAPSSDQLAALFINPNHSDEGENGRYVAKYNYTVLKEYAKMELYKQESDFYTISKLKDNKVYAIRFLRKTSNGDYYMTPYTAAYRYDFKGSWSDNSSDENVALEISMRPLGGTTNKYNEHDKGYHSPTFSESDLADLLKIVAEDNDRPDYALKHIRWWIDNPLREDDVVREYPTVGYYAWSNLQYWHFGRSSTLTIASVKQNGSSLQIFQAGREQRTHRTLFEVKVNDNAYAPIILLADRLVIDVKP